MPEQDFFFPFWNSVFITWWKTNLQLGVSLEGGLLMVCAFIRWPSGGRSRAFWTRPWWYSQAADTFPFRKHHTLQRAQSAVLSSLREALLDCFNRFHVCALVHLVSTHCSYVVRLIFINLHASEGKEHPAKDSILLASSGMGPLQAGNSGTPERSFPKCLCRLPKAQCASNLLEFYCHPTTEH